MPTKPLPKSEGQSENAPIAALKSRAKPSNTEADLIKDARGVHGAAVKHLPAFQKKDKEDDREEPTVTRQMIAEYARDIDDSEKAMNGQMVQRLIASQVTSDEETLRAELHPLIIEARDDIKLTYPADKVIQRAFGVGRMIKPDSTPILLAIAGTIAEYVKVAEHKTQARKAGVGEAKTKKIEVKATALRDADLHQGKTTDAGKLKTMSKKELFAAVTARTSYLRKAAKARLRNNKEAQVDFASKLPKRTAKPRKK